MIKGLTFLHAVGSPAEYDRVQSFFGALGMEPGPGWENAGSRAVSFKAPVGLVELLDGKIDTPAELLVEVTQLGAVRDAAEAWLRAHGATADEQVAEQLSTIAPTEWKTELFTAIPAPGVSIAFWEWAEPLKNKPAAMEGDLIATGMRFAIVVARWNAVITDRLLQGAMDCLLRSGARRGDIEIVRVGDPRCRARPGKHGPGRRYRYAGCSAARRNRALRGDLQRGIARHWPEPAGDRRAARIRRAHLRDAGAGTGPSRPEGWKQRF
jgi:hypothetical protein